MSENLHNIDDLFRDAINSHSEPPSPDVWDKIDKNLDKDNVIHIRKKYTALKWVACALFLFGFSMGIYALLTRMKNKELAKQNKINSKRIEKSGDRKIAPVAFDSAASRVEATPNVDDDSKRMNGSSDVVKRDSLSSAGAGEMINRSDRRSANKTSSAKQDQKRSSEGNVANANGNVSKQGENVGAAIKKKASSSGDDKIADDNVGSNTRSANNLDNKVTKGLSAKVKLKNDKASDREVLQATGKTSSNAVDVLHQNTSAEMPDDVKAYMRPWAAYPTAKIDVKEFSSELAGVAAKSMKAQPIVLNKTGVVTKAGNSKTKNVRSPKSSTSGFSLTAFFSPDFVASSVEDDKPRFREDNKREIKDKETNGFSSTVGVLVNYDMASNWSLQSGLTFMNRVTNIAPKTIFARPDSRGNVNYRFNCSAGYSFLATKVGGTAPNNGDSIISLQSKNTLQYIGIPIFVKYRFSKGSFSLNPGAGISANFLVKKMIETGTANQREVITDISGVSSTYFSGGISLEAAYKLSSRLALSVAPSFRLGLTSINKEAPVKTYLNSFSVAGGLTFKL